MGESQHPYDTFRVPNAPDELLARIYEAFRTYQYELDEHAFERMNQRNVSPREIPQIVREGTPIEYDAPRSGGRRVPGVLFNGRTSGDRPLHVKVTEEERSRGYKHYVVTVYEPSGEIFTDEYSRRRNRT